MNSISEKRKIINQQSNVKSRRFQIADLDEAHIKTLKKFLLALGVFLLFAYVTWGVVRSGGEPLGDLKMNPERRSKSSLSPFKANAYRDTQPSTTKVQTQKFSSMRKRLGGLELFQRPSIPLPPGLIVKAILSTGAAQGPVEAKVTEDAKKNGETLIDAGSTLRGMASQAEDRVAIHFTKLRRKDGVEESVRAIAYDFEDKIAGVKTSKFWREIKKLSLSAALNFAGGLAEGLEDSSVKNNVAVRDSSMKNGILNGIKDSARSEAQEIISDARSNPPISSVPESTIILAVFE